MHGSCNRRHRSGSQSRAFHDRCIHALDSIQLLIGPESRIEQTGSFQHADREFDRLDRGNVVLQKLEAFNQSLLQAERLML